MHGHVIAHGNGSSLAIEDCAGVIAPLFDVRRKRGSRSAAPISSAMECTALWKIASSMDRRPHKSCCFLLTNRYNQVSMLSTRALHPGGSTVAEVYSVIKAGPSMLYPAISPSRR